MRIEQRQWTPTGGWDRAPSPSFGEGAHLALVFGPAALLETPARLAELRRAYPRALLFGCSTAGEIRGAEVRDGTLTVAAARFDSTRLRAAYASASDAADGREIGARLAAALPSEGLVHVLVLLDGLAFPGSDVARGLAEVLPPGVAVTGGLAGDGPRYKRTCVLVDGEPRSGAFAALGLYGDRLKVGYASLGGWDPFGPERLITRSKRNVLYELDGKSALELYKAYLGDKARELPASGLLFPLSLRTNDRSRRVVRTVQAVDEADSSMRFSDYMPEGGYAQLMKGNFDRLIDGAAGAARICRESLRGSSPQLAILISCIGRKLLLKQRIDEEVEGVRDVVGAATVLTGFYSYGEISPFTPGANCELHNQTMTITALTET